MKTLTKIQKNIKKTNLYKKIIKIMNSNRFASFIIKSSFTIIIWLLTLIPLWLYLLTRWFFSPEGFWQEIVIAIIFGTFLGAIQFYLIILGVGLTVAIILDRSL